MQRRKFIKKATLSSMASVLGAEIVFGQSLPLGYYPLGLQEPDPFKLFSKDTRMVLLNDKPWNMEAQAHLLDDRTTPNKFMFIRNNGNIPKKIDIAYYLTLFSGLLFFKLSKK